MQISEEVEAVSSGFSDLSTDGNTFDNNKPTSKLNQVEPQAKMDVMEGMAVPAHFGLYQFKKLVFNLNSTAGKYHNVTKAIFEVGVQQRDHDQTSGELKKMALSDGTSGSERPWQQVSDSFDVPPYSQVPTGTNRRSRDDRSGD